MTSVALNTFNFEAAAICTINVGAGVLLEPLFLPTTTNGAIAESLVNPIVAIHTLPFVGSFQVSYPAAPLLGCPGDYSIAPLLKQLHVQLLPGFMLSCICLPSKFYPISIFHYVDRSADISTHMKYSLLAWTPRTTDPR